MSTKILSSISTTLKTTTASDTSKSNEDDDYDAEEEMTEAAEVAVPFAITVVVIIILIATVIYAKFRKSQMRRNNPSQMPTISGGIPMSTAAFHNQAFRQNSNGSVPENTYYDPPPMYSGQMPPVIPVTPVYPPNLPYYSEAPPKYDDIVKTSTNAEAMINIDNTNDPNISQHQETEVQNESGVVVNNNSSQSAKLTDENSPIEPKEVISNMSVSNVQNSSLNETNSLPGNSGINSSSHHVNNDINSANHENNSDINSANRENNSDINSTHLSVNSDVNSAFHTENSDEHYCSQRVNSDINSESTSNAQGGTPTDTSL